MKVIWETQMGEICERTPLFRFKMLIFRGVTSVPIYKAIYSDYNPFYSPHRVYMMGFGVRFDKPGNLRCHMQVVKYGYISLDDDYPYHPCN